MVSVIFKINEVPLTHVAARILQRCPSLREMKSLAQGHAASEQRNQFPNSHMSDCKTNAYTNLYMWLQSAG